jgi:hypothetical protein
VSGEDVFRLLLCLIGVKRRHALGGLVDGLLDKRREHARRSRAHHSRKQRQAVPMPAAHGDRAPDAVLVDARPPRAGTCAAFHCDTASTPSAAFTASSHTVCPGAYSHTMSRAWSNRSHN